MLDEVRLAHTHLSHVGGELLHHVELVVTGEDKHPGVLHDVRHALLRLCLAVVEEHIVGDDVGERVLLQRMLPQVGSLEAVRVHRVARALAVGQSAVEGHEVALLLVEVRAEIRLVLVHGEVSEAAAEAEERFFGRAFLLVLLDAVHMRRLVRPRVFQFEGEQRQAVHKEREVEFQPRTGLRERLLASERKLVESVEAVRLLAVGGRGSGVE